MNKKVFISYAWGTKKQQEWIVNLGKRLMNDTVDVELDKWSLKDGHDTYAYMESMVKSEDIFRVLIISDKNYQEKADDRKGGVGTETQIITPEIYKDQKQEKFIPILLERDDDGEVYLPIFLKTRKYIDFTKEEYFEKSYEELLRNILEAPSIPKPKLGTNPPSYITDSAVNDYEISSLYRSINNQLDKNPGKINSLAREFFDKFLETLWVFELKNTSTHNDAIAEELLNNLKSYKIIREDFILFMDKITQTEYSIDVDKLIVFFEKKDNYLKPRDYKSGSYYTSSLEIFKIIFHELFIYTIAVALKNENYELVGDLLNSTYFFEGSYNENPEKFSKLHSRSKILQDYMKKNFNKITGMGDYLITNLSQKIKKSDFILADILCHYILELKSDNSQKYSKEWWFPVTYIYNEDNRRFRFKFFQKMCSLRHFEKVKTIFNVETSEQFKKLLDDCKKYNENNNIPKTRFNDNPFSVLPFIYEIINVENIGKDR